MHLAIDIGNTSVKFGLYKDDKLLEKGSGIGQLRPAVEKHGGDISAAMIASVADTAPVTELLKNLNVSYSLLSSDTRLPIGNNYKSPGTLGVDRIALAVAANGIYPNEPVLVIGAGTCITYNFVNEGHFEGGAISPGITMRFQALHHYTARLPYIDWTPYQNTVYDTMTGDDSQSSIVAGVLKGAIHEIDGTIEAYRARYSGLRVMATGGDTDFLVKNLKNDIFARPDMVLEGLHHILIHHA